MDTPVTEAELLFEQIEDYTKISVELFKLRTVEKASGVAVSVVSMAGVAIVVMLFMIACTVGAALLLGDILGKAYYGFFIMGAVCLLISILFYLNLEKWLRKPISKMVIKKILT